MIEFRQNFYFASKIILFIFRSPPEGDKTQFHRATSTRFSSRQASLVSRRPVAMDKVVAEEEEERQLLWRSSSESMVSLTLGRVLTSLLSARPKKLRDAASRFSPELRSFPTGSLDESLLFLYKFVKDSAERKERLDQILVPMFEHSLRSRESRHCGQILILLDWLVQDEFLFQYFIESLADIISRKEDRYVSLGWCTLVRGLLECESAINQYLLDGLRRKYYVILEMLCPCISHLSSIIRKGSSLQDGYELPSRLSISAADCFLALTEALTRKDEIVSNQKSYVDLDVSSCSSAAAADEGTVGIPKMELEPKNLLSYHLEELVNVVQLLFAWSRKSRSLHSRGLEGVLKWLLDIKKHSGCSQNEADLNIMKTQELLLSSCWKHYSKLLHLEDHRFSQHHKAWLEQYLSGIQSCAERCSYRHEEYDEGRAETRKFFLNCLCLLLGRLVGKRFETTVLEYGSQIFQVLLPQLNCADEEVIHGIVCIFKETIFKLSCSNESSLVEKEQFDALLPLLLQLLDERDGTARAAVTLIAEYCSINSENHCVKEVIDRLACGNTMQRRNAIDVICELISISSKTASGLPHLKWEDIANGLLRCLSDGDCKIRELASDSLSNMEPAIVLPRLVRILYTSDRTLQSSARKAFIGMLRSHKQKCEVIFMLLDCLSNLNSSLEITKTTGEKLGESNLEADQVLRLTPEWSDSVEDWKTLVGSLIDKMFSEPSNAVLVRFLSYISEHLADAKDMVLHHILLCMQGQKEVDKSLLALRDTSNSASYDAERMQKSLFERLSPLLILRILPLRVFDDLNSSILYGQLLNQDSVHANAGAGIIDDGCVAALLLKRAFSNIEFEDVRKLAAELCGRLYPLVLLPIIRFHLEDAACHQDILKIKACLFSVCTSLVVRGRDPSFDPVMLEIIKFLEEVLRWPSLDGDDVSKAQHGCIDCLALMICGELQSPESFSDFDLRKITFSRGKGKTVSCSVLSHVICQLIANEVESTSGFSNEPPVLPFRLCMANVLISVCQKTAEGGKKSFSQKAIPVLIHSIEAIRDAEIRAACIQVLFSAVYHLKSAVLPYSSDLLKLSLKYLEEGTEKERMAAAKLVASLMASEDAILVSISGGLVEARSVLLTLSRSDPSKVVRETCKKLVVCISSS
ncbi:uncharacterized protein LOC115732156 [Rhodamnia argentea]|uniref:Uncharacterized protein LOC115732156 n=1 Tax=Rhodamnia argentea TaxID=178133 RepID=A0A8B8N9P4_9MYRT|nr:uncharacterized protein LOC115732156 [Rhodamnia argentea]